MKNHLYFLLLLSGTLLLTHCQNNSTGNKDEAAADAAVLEGFWVNDAWWQVLQQSKSPLNAMPEADIAAVVVQQDSNIWVADLSYGWHEGMRFGLQAAGDAFHLTDPYENNKVKHRLSLQPDGSLHLDSLAFVRIGDSRNGYDAIPASILAGTYSLAGTTGLVTFNPDGSLAGLDNYTQYDLLIDYVTDEIGSDQLMLDTGEEDPDFYAFQFKGNQLIISSIELSGESEEYPTYKVGNVKYVLTKK
jgi:hypothetical protein